MIEQKFTAYQPPVKRATEFGYTTEKGVKMEIVDTTIQTDYSDFPKEKFPNMYRAPVGGSGRYYFLKGGNEFYSGITGAISRSCTSDKSMLHKAEVELARKGINARELWDVRANYGSCCHLMIALHERKEIDFRFDNSEWHSIVEDFLKTYGYERERELWMSQIQNDMHTWFAFKKAYDVRVVATEIAVRDDVHRIATPLDIICEMTFNRKRIYADINWKTGDQRFNADYGIQVALEAWMYNQQIGDSKYKLDGAFCLRPKDRAKSPGQFELSKNYISTYTEDDFHDVWRACIKNSLYKPTGSVIRYMGGEQDAYIQIMSAYGWLAEFNADTMPQTNSLLFNGETEMPY